MSSSILSNDINNNLNQSQTGKIPAYLNESKYSGSISNISMERTIYQFKLILIGDVAVGKTSIISRYIDNKYSPIYKCSIGVEFKIKSITLDAFSGADWKIWDTCGEEKYRSWTRQYYRDTNGLVLIFDWTSRETFLHIDRWLRDVKENIDTSNIPIFIVGNKSDLDKVVEDDEIELYVKGKKWKYLEVSAKTGANVDLLFEKLTREMVTVVVEEMKEEKEKSIVGNNSNNNDNDNNNTSKSSQTDNQGKTIKKGRINLNCSSSSKDRAKANEYSNNSFKMNRHPNEKQLTNKEYNKMRDSKTNCC